MVAAALYARISSDDGTALGVARQLEDCRREAERRGWAVASQYVDNDVSAFSGKARPEFDRLLADVRAGRVGAVVVWDVDRLTRTPRELEAVIDLFDAHRVDLASVGGEIDLGTPQGRLTARLKGAVARHEVEQSSRRLRRKMQERAEAGKPHGRVAYGWRRVDGVDVLDDAEAAVVREIARRLLARESARSVWRDLNARGVPSPGGAAWSGAILRQTMLRERNAGRRTHRGEVVGKGAWEAIVDDDTHDRVVALLRDPERVVSRGSERRWLLSGIARCGRCGTPMQVNHGGGRAGAAYTCPGCHRVRRAVHHVDAFVEAVVVARLSEPDGPDLLAGDPDALREARDAAEALRARLDLAADQYADGAITADQLRRITARLRPRLDDAEARARAAAPAPELAAVANGAAAAWGDTPLEARRAVINALMTVTILPSGPGQRFDPERVVISWRYADGEQAP